MRKNGFETLILKGQIEGNRDKGVAYLIAFWESIAEDITSGRNNKKTNLNKTCKEEEEVESLDCVYHEWKRRIKEFYFGTLDWG